ncbi:hypothetical protein M0805_002204 [Coniferiporia weirii]|nr:hypothetical protein M0805_002204 [Coniferiporia weirii]
MTLLVPLDGTAPPQAWPAFVSPADDPATLAARVVQTVLRAKRIAVVCGAGISVQAGIPDFRSADGLFQSIKRENPKENLSSGKDLFDASVLNSEHTTALFYQMMARLARLSSEAVPTPFHSVLRELDDRGKLLRVYTQNIDALEEKAGMSFGLPENRGRRARTKAQKSAPQSGEELNLLEGSSNVIMGVPPQQSETADVSLLPSLASTSARSTPRCIPLHGTLQNVHCVSCTHSFPLSDHLPSLLAGVPPDCPECAVLEVTRSLVGKRPRGVGRLRPSVVLYNEDHRDGEDVGAVVRRDLARGARGGADVLLVVGTSLRVPGTKRIVREFAKAVRARERARAERALEVAQARAAALPTPAATPTPTSSPSPSPRRTPVRDDETAPAERPITTVYVNLDFPVPTREWDGVFDVWVQGDAQMFAGMLHDEMVRGERARAEKVERDERAREERRAREDRRRREREAREAEREELGALAPKKKVVKGQKRAAPAVSPGDVKPAKRRRVTLIVRDPDAPLSPKSPSKRAVMKGRGRGAQSSALETTNAGNASAGIKSAFASQRGTKHTGMGSPKSPSSRHPHIAAPGRMVPEVVIPVHPMRPPSPSSLSSSSVSTIMDSPDTHSPGESSSETGSANLCSWPEQEHEPGGSSLDLLACAAASRPRVSFGSGSSSPVDVCGEGEFEFTPCMYDYVPQCTCRGCSDEQDAYDTRPPCALPFARAPPTPLSMPRRTRAGEAAAGMGTRGARAHAYAPETSGFGDVDGSSAHLEDDAGAVPPPAAPARRKRVRGRTSVRWAGPPDVGWSAAAVSEEDRFA